MAIINTDNNIVLTGETAKSFSNKMKNPSKEVMRKRDEFLKECRENIEIIKCENRKIRLIYKE